MDSVVLDGGIPFRFPSEIITGYNPLLHPRDPIEIHNEQVRAAKADCFQFNKKFPVVIAKPTNRKTKH